MRIEKDQRRVDILCEGDTLIRGTVHINPGERLLDFFKNLKKDFIAVTNVEVVKAKNATLFKSYDQKNKQKNTVILNIVYIKLVKEI